MRKWSIILAVSVALTLVFGAVACGGSQATVGANTHSPQEVLAATFAASNEVAKATGGFDFALSVDVDLSQVPSDVMRFVGPLAENGIALSGTFASDSDSRVAEFSATGDVMGESIDVGMMLAGEDMWLSYSGQWYEVPPEAMQSMDDYETQVDPAEVERLLADLGLDPVTWLKDLETVGEETVAGVETVHLTGTPDMMKMVNDVMELMRSEEFLALIDPQGMYTGQMMQGDFPSVSEVEEMRPMMEAMLAGITVDIWVAKSDATARKMAVQGYIAPPPGEDAEGLLGIDFSASMWFDSVGESVSVEPPDSALPIMQLMEDIQADPGLFDLFGGMTGAGPLYY